MGDGGANDMVNGGMAGESVNGAAGAATSDVTACDGPRELSRAAAVGATVLAAVCGCGVLLAMFHWLGWAVPGVGWIVAKAGIKLAVGGFAGLAVAAAWLRTKLRAGSRS
ncbi:hypothetical protein ACH4E7_26950 [Kitasatospora sp. NPDC018058]|uniref:hypothetical protein n=1 Tax=Kitasatospora sp. NPDC018058 TaxID=3364025 RepID=UPI0037BF4E6B